MSHANLATSVLFLITLLPACHEGTGAGPGESDDPVALGAAGDYAILAKTGISSGSPSTIKGDVGLSPAPASAMTGFDLKMDPSNAFATSTQVDGKVYAADYAQPTPDDLDSAVEDMQMAYKDARKRHSMTKQLGGGDVGGQMLTAGVYSWDSNLLIPSNLTLSGDVYDVWIFQIADDMIMNSKAEVMLAGSAQAKNVFWEVGGRVDIGESARCVGTILAKDSITLRKDAVVEGRLLTHTKVSLEANTVTAPVD